MGRPTLRDVAVTAGVSLATVNRVLSQSGKVRASTMERVLDAARQIGFYGASALQQRVAAARPVHRLGLIIQTPHRHFSEVMERSLLQASQMRVDQDVRLNMAHLDDLSPEHVAVQMAAMAPDCDAMAVLAAEHPLISDAIDRSAALGIPVVTFVTPLSARTSVAYVGLDSWKVGRTAAWAFSHFCRSPGKLGILVGTHRYRCHDLRESGFRSYCREHATGFKLLEPLSTFESDAIARELTEKLLYDHPDLVGLYVSGGGISGALAAIRAQGQAGRLAVVGHDLMDTTKAGLLDESLTLVISHPFDTIARETIDLSLRAKANGTDARAESVMVPFELFTSENL